MLLKRWKICALIDEMNEDVKSRELNLRVV